MEKNKRRAKFNCYDAKVKVKLSNGEIADVYTTLEAEGEYNYFWDAPTGQKEHGEVYYTEQYINNDSITFAYPDLYVFCDEAKQLEYEIIPKTYEGVTILEIIQLITLNFDWVVNEDSIEEI